MYVSSCPTITIPEWDWHYRVGFDSESVRRIEYAAATLECPEDRAILMGTLNWARDFISFDRLLEALETSEVSPGILAELDLDKVLHLPVSLVNKVGMRISRLADLLGSSSGRSLDRMLDKALLTPYRPLAQKLFEHVFGSKLASLLDEAKMVAPAPHPGFDPISMDEARALVAAFIRSASDHPLLQGLLDVSTLEVRYTDEPSGFAEYWPRELVPGRTRDLLIVHLNGQSLDRLALQSTLCHELYGHGSFYSLCRTCKPSLVDHGALLLVEGWATGYEWRFSSPSYAAWTRSRRLLSLSRLNATAEDLTTQIDTMIKEDKYPLNRDARLMETFQYPALAASYALGGLWFEREPCTGEIPEFVHLLKDRAWGDFMAAWSP